MEANNIEIENIIELNQINNGVISEEYPGVLV